MTDNQHPNRDRPVYRPVPPPRGRRSRPLFWLLMLFVLAGAAYGGWRGWHWTRGTLDAVATQQELLARLSREVQALRAQAEDLASRQTDLSAAVRRNGVDLAAIDGRLEGSEQAMARLSDTVEGGRARVHLAAVEQLLLMANDRLLLAHDGPGALKALDLADQRLALLNDPRLFRVREALAQERAALANLALPDYTGLALSLSQLSQRAPRLPLRGRVPERFAGTTEPEPPPPDAGTFGRLWAAVKAALSSMFTLRRSEGAAPRLLPPGEEALVAQVLQLRIDGARLALLSGDGRAFRELIGQAAAWLTEYYDASDLDVRATLAELRRLEGAPIATALPDISRSLALLRSHLGATPR